ncbi:MAG: hypothetical protein IPM38_18895 [Ignavibacteria bacterium]|nr:hypothetical protein [Ignavibacteria bacterium]
MKSIFLLLITSLLINVSFADQEMDQGELIIKNRIPDGYGIIKVKVYPIGAIFARGVGVQTIYMNYTAFAEPSDHPEFFPYITGGEKTLTPLS